MQLRSNGNQALITFQWKLVDAKTVMVSLMKFGPVFQKSVFGVFPWCGWVWTEGSKPVGRKSKNDSAKIGQKPGGQKYNKAEKI